MTPSDVKTVAENINDFIDVPDGINRIRKALLTLAVSGKLVPQYKNEGTAEDFYHQIQVQRLKIAKESIRQKKQGNESGLIAKEEEPFAVPSSWKWIRFQDTFFSVRGITFPGGDKSKELEDGYIAVLRSGNVQDSLNLSNLLYVPEKHVRNKNQYLQNGDVVVSMANSRELVGKSCLVRNLDAKYSFGGFLSVFRPYLISPEYFQMVFSSDFARARFFKDAKQVTNIANLSLATINLIPFPLPPLAEQKRIVEKVQSVMKQLDELELRKSERDLVRSRLTRSAMQALSSADPKIAFDQLTELIKTSQDIKELENAILTLAVSGKLVPQDKNEGTGADLYQKISATLLKPKKSKEIDAEDKLFNIPLSWIWTRLGDAFDVRDGTHDSPKYKDSGYPLVTSKNLYHGKLDFLNVKYVSETDHKKISERSKVDRDDILFAMIGSIGNPVIVDTDIEFSIKNVALFKYFDRKLTDPNFLLIYLKYASVNMRKVSAGGVQSFVSLGFLRQYPFPLPPLAEQKRIVAKVEELLEMINSLRSIIDA